MEATVTVSLTDEPQRYRTVGGKCSKLVATWPLVAVLISVQVFAASCLSFYLLKQQMRNELPALKQPDAKGMESTRCSTHWTAKYAPSSNIAWEDKNGQAFTGNCAEYNQSSQSLQIKKNGIYFVYVQVTFRQGVNNVNFYIRYDKEVKQQNSRNAGYKSVYFGSIYRLREDTEIFINTTNTSLISYGESMTFFGLFEV